MVWLPPECAKIWLFESCFISLMMLYTDVYKKLISGTHMYLSREICACTARVSFYITMIICGLYMEYGFCLQSINIEMLNKLNLS